MTYDWKQREIDENIDYEIFRPRIEWMCKYLTDEDKSVADFGCGSMIVKDYLHSDVKYYPIDYVDRGQGTILCNFNKKEFPQFDHIDCAFMSGFLQYIENPECLTERISKIFSKVIITYPVLEYFSDREDRKNSAWKNHLSKDELISLFTKYNFMVSALEYNDDFKQLLICFKNGKKHSVQNNFLCSGCSACVDKCPVNAISLKQDIQGRFMAFVDEDKCIKCGKCTEICPVIKPQFNNTLLPKCYAFDNNDELSFTSATAGGFQVLAKHFIENGGKVVGAGWVSDEYGNYTTVKHIIVDNTEDLKYLYKSKYLQSDMNDIYKITRQELEKGTKVLFSGLSCQIAGLYSMLGKDYDNLYTIDLICHHAPSQGYFKKYLDEQFGKNNVEEFDFRAKSKNDRYSLNLRAKLKSGKEIFKSHWEDAFCRLFHERYIMAECCEHCRFSKYPKQGDITLGDFHRIEQSDPDFLDFRTEAVLINTKKGQELFEILKHQAINLKEKDLALLSKGNKVCENYQAHPKRNLFKELIANNMSVTQAANIVLNNYYDIGLVGMPGNNNYGGALTYYALYNVLRDMGKSVLFIQQPEDSEWKPSTAMTAYKNNPYSDYDFAKTYPNKDAMRELNQFCDMFMVGSDQFFASVGLYEFCNKFTSLDWVEDRKKKVAYAASFGRDFITCDDYNRAMMGFFLHKFDRFTVRETSGIELCKREFNLDTDVVLDPVFLCPLKHYTKLIENGNYKDNNKIATYILDKTTLSQKIVDDIKNALNMDILSIDDAYNGSDYNNTKEDIPKIENWLSLINGCNFLVTDSFHGMCFAIIFQKPFIALCNKERGAARFESLVKLLGFTSRLIYNEDDYNNIKNKLQEINWNEVYDKLNHLKLNSKKILDEMLKSSENKKNLSDHDLYKPEIAFLKYENYLKGEQINEIKKQVNIGLPQNLSAINNDIAQISSKIKENFKNNFIDLVKNKGMFKPYPNEKDEIFDINFSDISVVVQGAINPQLTPQCLKSIRTYLPKAEIILSTWVGSNIDGLDCDKVVLSEDPGAVKCDVIDNTFNNQNRQLVSTREGLKYASRKYILKLRTDFELHSNEFINYFNKFPMRHKEANVFKHRVLISSIYSRTKGNWIVPYPVLFHPSDFFMFGLSDDIKNYFKNTRLATEEELGNWQYLYPERVPFPTCKFRYTPEQFFFLSYILQFYSNVKFEDWTEWNEANLEISENLLYNNFIFLDYKQSGIYSQKHSHALLNSNDIFGIINYTGFENIYKKHFDEKYVSLGDNRETESKNIISKNKEKYIKYNKKLHKHINKFFEPFKIFFNWIVQPFSIFYYFLKKTFSKYFLRKILSCFIFNQAKRRKYRDEEKY